jgi:hypothetical protein
MKKSLIQSAGKSAFIPLFIVILFMSTFSSAQKLKLGSMDFKSAIGYKNIMLGADIGSLNFSKLDYLDGDNSFDADSCINYAVCDSSVLKFNDKIRLDMIGIRTYKNKIVNIYLFFPKPEGYGMLNNFISTYGGFFSKPNENSNIYNWDSKNVTLSLMYQADVADGVAEFTLKPLTQYIAQAKEIASLREKAKALKASKTSAATKNILSFNKQ